MNTHRPALRNCPFCGANGNDDEVVQITTTVQHLTDGAFLELGAEVECTVCAARVFAETVNEVAALWNGEPEQ